MSARLSPQREAEPSRRDDLLKLLRLGSAHSERSANYLLDTFAAEVREQVEAELTAVRADAQRALDLLMSGNGYEAALLLDSITGTEVTS